jgi:hypothetical protein
MPSYRELHFAGLLVIIICSCVAFAILNISRAVSRFSDQLFNLHRNGINLFQDFNLTTADMSTISAYSKLDALGETYDSVFGDVIFKDQEKNQIRIRGTFKIGFWLTSKNC